MRGDETYETQSNDVRSVYSGLSRACECCKHTCMAVDGVKDASEGCGKGAGALLSPPLAFTDMHFSLSRGIIKHSAKPQGRRI